MENPKTKDGRLDLDNERYDQTTFLGRYKVFFAMCNPLNLFTSEEKLMRARDIINRYEKGENVNLSDEEVWRQKSLYDSAFHPVSERIIPHIGRISAQCPVNGLVMGAMLIFYKTKKEAIFWQWINQSLNAFVNQMNSSDPRIEWKEAVKGYGMAVGTALPLTLVLSEIGLRMGAIAQRFVPLLSIALANAINIPLCRQKELKEGIQLWYQGKEIAKSEKMAVQGISKVAISRIAIQVPHMLLLPIVMLKMEPFFRKHPKLSIPFQLSVCTFSLLFSTPMGCALFPHKTFVPVSDLEPEVQEEIRKKTTNNPATSVYFNMGI